MTETRGSRPTPSDDSAAGASAGVLRELMIPDAVPILMYHEVSDRPDPRFRRYTVSTGLFERQVRYLAARGYESIGLERVWSWHAFGSQLPERPVVLTFDDGFLDCIRNAPPILRRYGFCATFFIVAGLIGRPSAWLEREVGLTRKLADWADLERLKSEGFACGSHTVSHPRLSALADGTCRDELERSRRLLEERLGGPIDALAYPFGSNDERVQRLAAEAGYRTAVTTRLALATRDESALALSRIEVRGGEGILTLRSRLRSAGAPVDRLRLAAERLQRVARRGVRAAAGRVRGPS